MKKLLLLFILLFSSSTLARTLEVDTTKSGECDEIFQDMGCVGGSEVNQMRDRINQNVGIVLPPSQGMVPHFSVGAVVVRETGRSRFVPSSLPRNPGTPSQSSNTLEGETPGSGESQSQQALGQQPAQELFGQAGGAQQHRSINGQNGLQVRNGLVYADDEVPTDIEASGAVGDGQLGARLSTTENPQALSAVDLNRNQDTGREPNTGSVIAAMNGLNRGGLPKGPGRYEAGGGAKSRKPARNGLLDSLKAMAGNLGERFFGSLGSGSNLGASGTQIVRGRGKSLKGSGLASASAAGGASGVNIEGIYNQYQKRGLASEMEFGSSGGWMFKNMCEHWSRLAKKEKLGANQQACPD